MQFLPFFAQNVKVHTVFISDKNAFSMKKGENYVAYYRVSTRKQGQKGLSLTAQKRNIAIFVEYSNAQIVGEFQDVQSGKDANRKGLLQAIELCRKKNACLIVATQDRLSRDFDIIKKLISEKRNPLRFKSLDNLEGSENYVVSSVLGLVADVEHKLITERNRKAVAFRRQRGDFDGEKGLKILQNLAGKEGSSLIDKLIEGRQKGLETRQRNVNERYEKLALYIVALEKSGDYPTLGMKAKKLTELGCKTLSGKPVDITLVRRVMQKMRAKDNARIVANDTKKKGTIKKQAAENIEAVVMHQYDNGVCYSQIAKYLNALGVQTVGGGKFYSQTIKRIVEKALENRNQNENYHATETEQTEAQNTEKQAIETEKSIALA